ncbi:hypothetical protein ACE1CD_19545 [Aerosakkonema sp. BLCC-F183]|uniref:hypothetical protein n=1 Tax=Aerosakkonema sp. BLCC-F183 TaxID=3342834 RepID=UPI0035B776E0
MPLFTTLQFTQMLLAETSSCHTVGPAELIAITVVLGGLLTFAGTASVPAMTIAIPAAVAKILAGLAIGVSFTAITVPLQPFLEIAAVAAVAESIKHILGCG